MKIIDRLNEKMNYNQETFWLFIILSIIFSTTSYILIKYYAADPFIFIVLAAFCWGIAIGYFFYNRNDDITHGYKLRDKIRKLRMWRL